MRKIFVAQMVVLLAVPALAADGRYGSQRDRHLVYGNVNTPATAARTAIATTPPPRCTSRATAAWAPRSRPTRSPARSSSRSAPAATVRTPAVATRRGFGVWKFERHRQPKVQGRQGLFPGNRLDHSNPRTTPTTTSTATDISTAAVRPIFTLYVGDFELAALVPIYGDDVNTTAIGVNGATGGTDPDSYIPRLEAAYNVEVRHEVRPALRRLPVVHGRTGRLRGHSPTTSTCVLRRSGSAPLEHRPLLVGGQARLGHERRRGPGLGRRPERAAPQPRPI